jgi:hypothetical protein
MAGPTRLELATSCVTGRRSNRLNYGPVARLSYHLRSVRPNAARAWKASPRDAGAFAEDARIAIRDGFLEVSKRGRLEAYGKTRKSACLRRMLNWFVSTFAAWIQFILVCKRFST